MAKSFSPARFLALKWLHKCLSEGDTLLDAMTDVPHDMDPRDLGLAREIASGTCRHLSRVRYQLQQAAPRWEKFPPMVQRCLELSIYQLTELDRVPAYAVISDAVELVRHHRFGGLTKPVNGILRAIERKPKPFDPSAQKHLLSRNLSIQHSHPEWLVRDWIKSIGEDEAAALCEFNNTRAPLSLRLRPPVDEALATLDQHGVTYTRDERFPDRVVITSEADWKTEWFSSPQWSVQDGAAMLVCAALGAQPGWDIWDACAAPGGKTFALADAMQGEGSLLATDRSSERLTRLQERARELRIPTIQTRAWDALKPWKDREQMFDAVLIDAPCTGLGTFRKHPDLRWRLQQKDSKRLGHHALTMLKTVSTQVKPGGVLLYSTCTLSRAENESVVERFLAESDAFETLPLGDEIPVAFREAISPEGWLSIHPTRWSLDGAFAARMICKPRS